MLSIPRVFIDWIITQLVVSDAFLPVFGLLNFIIKGLYNPFIGKQIRRKAMALHWTIYPGSNERFSAAYKQFCFIELQVSGREFLLMPQNVGMLI